MVGLIASINEEISHALSAVFSSSHANLIHGEHYNFFLNYHTITTNPPDLAFI